MQQKLCNQIEREINNPSSPPPPPVWVWADCWHAGRVIRMVCRLNFCCSTPRGRQARPTCWRQQTILLSPWNLSLFIMSHRRKLEKQNKCRLSQWNVYCPEKQLHSLGQPVPKKYKSLQKHVEPLEGTQHFSPLAGRLSQCLSVNLVLALFLFPPFSFSPSLLFLKSYLMIWWKSQVYVLQQHCMWHFHLEKNGVVWRNKSFVFMGCKCLNKPFYSHIAKTNIHIFFQLTKSPLLYPI